MRTLTDFDKKEILALALAISSEEEDGRGIHIGTDGPMTTDTRPEGAHP